MSDVAFYFFTGWHHIISWTALDHILFIIALAAIYLIQDWKQVLVLVTAFTIGHSLTLALSVNNVMRFNDKWVEFLIPCTILTTAIVNFFIRTYKPKSLRINYFLALAFGLIHGMGFANAIRFMLAKGEAVGWPLFGFNVGLEVGQIAVVTLILSVSYLLVNKVGLPRIWWIWCLSGMAAIVSVNMAIGRWPL